MGNNAPVIGIVGALEQAQYGIWDKPCVLTQTTYTEAIQRVGGVAILIAPDPAVVDDPDLILDRIDALVLAGGADIDPAAYGAEPHPLTVNTVPERDAVEVALARRAIERDMPVLGICRGMQVLNVAYGGTLIQDLPELFGHEEHRRVVGSFDGAEHVVVLVPGSLAATAAGEQHHITRSHHHQGVDRLGDGLVISGRAVMDELPEAIEAPEQTFVLGVQWHPEVDPDSRIIGALVERARQTAAAQAGSS
jgi:putative glutamine amidotransferase